MKEIETPTATIGHYGEDNLLRIRVKENSTVGLAEVNSHFLQEYRLTEGRKPLVLVDIRTNFSMDARTRMYAIQQSSSSHLATAILIRSGFKSLFINLYFQIRKPATPIQFFSAEEYAYQWLKGFDVKSII